MGESEIDKDGGGKVGRRPTIAVPPRAPFESLFAGGTMPGYSPGPMTLLSNIFSPDSSSFSFSQLLAGAMASPHAKAAFLGGHDYGNSGDLNVGDGNEKGSSGGYKQNRPGDLVLAQSPAFAFPPGLSPSGFLNSPGLLSPLQSPFGMSHQQALAHVTAQAALSQYVQSQADFQRSSAESLELKQSSVPSETTQQQVHTLEMDPHQNLKVESSIVSQSEHKPGSSGFDKPGSDGYNWRKYGQKLVKTKEYPRSYYKCTHPCCPVKKKVEHGNDGQVTEITYKGQHNHEKPSPNARAKDGSGPDKAAGSRIKPEMKISNETTLHFSDGTSTQVPYGQLLITGRKEEMEESAIVLNDDNDHNEPNAKRRIIEAVAHVPTPTHQTITEPKIVVQTRSEVDLLDDGFKWRKYGQKVVKGSAHPRSYYRCTFAGCNVRKHVERASLDPKSVITTYEGKHNHEIPSGRNSGQNNLNSGGQSKPQNVVARKPPPPVHKEVNFGTKDHIAVLTQI